MYIYVCMYVYMYVGMSSIVYGKTIQNNRMLKCVGGIMYSKHAHAQKAVLGFGNKVQIKTSAWNS